MKCNMVDYNNFSKTFAASRKNMKWEEVSYFLEQCHPSDSLLDVWCGSGRLLEQYKNHFEKIPDSYLWVDMSEWLIKEAKKNFPSAHFLVWNMTELSQHIIDSSFDTIFCIAAFHHLQSYDDRKSVLLQLYKILKKWWKIFFTNWALDSNYNSIKYKKSQILWSLDSFWSSDYNIKLGQNSRYYHNFSLSELDCLFKEVWFEILENRLFDSEKNIISILTK